MDSLRFNWIFYHCCTTRQLVVGGRLCAKGFDMKNACLNDKVSCSGLGDETLC